MALPRLIIFMFLFFIVCMYLCMFVYIYFSLVFESKVARTLGASRRSFFFNSPLFLLASGLGASLVFLFFVVFVIFLYSMLLLYFVFLLYLN